MFGLLPFATVVLAVLKLAGVWVIPWLAVFLPLAFFVVALVGTLMVVCLVGLVVGNGGERRWG